MTAITEVVRSWLGTTPSSLGIISALQTTKAEAAGILRHGKDSSIAVPPNTIIPESQAANDEIPYKIAA